MYSQALHKGIQSHKLNKSEQLLLETADMYIFILGRRLNKVEQLHL